MIRLADHLTLPLDVVTQTIAILAKRRAGKSYAMRRLAEQLFKAGQQVVIVDPKGDQWGVRSAADGKAPGLPIVILGGERGDVPLEASGGEVVAKLVVEERVSVLLDISLFRKHEVATFMTAFLENLYRLKAREVYRTPMMLVIDEADAIAPQKPQKGEERMLGAAEDIVRRGGQRGIGCVLVTQRSAVLNKNVLTQAQMLVALRTIAPQDLAAMNAWIDVHGTEEQKRTLMESLPALPVGDAWFWSPGWPSADGIFKRVHVLPIETFDSGATPKAGETRTEPKKVADVDLEALKRQMSATIERAKADDPRELRKRIAALEKDLKAKPGQTTVESRIDVPVIRAADMKRLDTALRAFERAAAIVEKVEPHVYSIRQLLEKWKPDDTHTYRIEFVRKGPAAPVSRAPSAPLVAPQPRRSAEPRGAAGGSPVSSENGKLGRAERAILSVLAQHDDGCRAGKLALLAGYSWSGGFRNSLSLLRTLGLIEGGNQDQMRITEAGLASGEFERLPEGEQLRDYWMTHRAFGRAERETLRILIDKYPQALPGPKLAEMAGYEWSGGFRNALSALRTAGVVIGRNNEGLSASEDLFS